MIVYWHADNATAQAHSMIRGSNDSAGLDLAVVLDDGHEEIAIGGLQNEVISTGVRVAIPEGHYGLVLMRSGMGFKRNLMCHPGVIDSDYRGEIKVKVFNLHQQVQYLQHGERFAQLIIQPFANLAPHHMPLDEFELLRTERGFGGFGSTGK